MNVTLLLLGLVLFFIVILGIMISQKFSKEEKMKKREYKESMDALHKSIKREQEYFMRN